MNLRCSSIVERGVASPLAVGARTMACRELGSEMFGPVRGLSLGDFARVSMTPSSPGWWKSVPAAAGWYAIETNAPISTFLAAAEPRMPSKNYKLAARASNSSVLITCGLAIVPSSAGARFVVYSGEHANLKARAREHTHGDKGTGCLCLSQYEDLCAFDWSFLFLEFIRHIDGCTDNKMLRTILEQRWRVENGWPILCSQ